MLMCKIRHKSLEIVDFFRNFTVEVTGVGDVCSFAQMDVRRHGNPTVFIKILHLNIFSTATTAGLQNPIDLCLLFYLDTFVIYSSG